MASFDLFLPIVLRNEGGYVNNPADPGGETNKGITIGTFNQCAHDLLGIDPTSANLRALTDAQAALIYRTLYWNVIQGDSYPSQDLANIVGDFYVTSRAHATKLLQHVLNSMGAHLTEDGGIGPATLAALAAADPVQVYRRFKAGRIAFYQSLAAKYPSFVNGWLARVNRFPDL